MVIEDEARAEAERRYPSNHIVDDPFGATGEAWSDEYGYEEYARNAFIAGAEWQASRNVEPVDNAGDVLDATVRYAKSWRAEGGEVFGPSLMLDLVAMVREARAELAAATMVAPSAERGQLAEVVLAAWGGWPDEMDGAHPAITIAVAVLAAGYRRVIGKIHPDDEEMSISIEAEK